MLDTGLARPPSPTYTAITPATRASEQNEPSARTELPAEETVTPTTETESSQRSANNEREQRPPVEPSTPQVERQNVIDPESESFVYVATNTDTGQVVRQIPSETLLRLRAYAKTVETQQSQQTQETSQPFQRVV
jgi:flagellar protein FlaG